MTQRKQGAIAFNSWVLMTTLGKQQNHVGVGPHNKQEVLVGLAATVMGPGGQGVWGSRAYLGWPGRASSKCVIGQCSGRFSNVNEKSFRLCILTCFMALWKGAWSGKSWPEFESHFLYSLGDLRHLTYSLGDCFIICRLVMANTAWEQVPTNRKSGWRFLQNIFLPFLS